MREADQKPQKSRQIRDRVRTSGTALAGASGLVACALARGFSRPCTTVVHSRVLRRDDGWRRPSCRERSRSRFPRSPVVVVEDDATQSYGFLTAGHVADDGASEMRIPDPGRPSMFITAHIPRPFRRCLERSSFRVENDMEDSWLDEAMVLLLRGHDHRAFDFHIPGCNLVAFNDGEFDELDRCEPLRVERRTALHDFLTQTGRIQAFKRGSATGRTARWFTRIRNQMPIDPDHEDDSLEERQDMCQWIGEIEWDNSAFSGAGDSGAFVWTTRGDEVVPLGIHLGRSPFSPVSLFASVDAFALELRRAGYSMSFF